MARVTSENAKSAAVQPRDYNGLLAGIPEGEYVALFHDEHAVAGHGPTLKSAHEAALQAGEPHPVFLRIPRWGIAG